MAKSPLKRLGTVDEMAELVLWLCSEAPSVSRGASSTFPAVARPISRMRAMPAR
jgi:NAD(P)-dependent dehydrogenase (short-subunit alcohol dehydrogenase family)